MGFVSTPEPGQAVGTNRKSFNVGLASSEKSGSSWISFKRPLISSSNHSNRTLKDGKVVEVAGVEQI
jgi:hypothetical protein